MLPVVLFVWFMFMCDAILLLVDVVLSCVILCVCALLLLLLLFVCLFVY